MSVDEWKQEWVGREFSLGSHDCATFTFDYVKEKTAIDLLEEWREKYQSDMDIARFVVASESKDAAEMVFKTANKMGWELTDNNAGGNVAICKCDQTRRHMFGLCNGRGGALSFFDYGIALIHPNNIVEIWEKR